MQIPAPLERLVEEFSRFPGVGRKTAQRLAFRVLSYTPEEARNFAEAIVRVKEQIRPCSSCFIFTDNDPCDICSSSSRERNQLCVVEQANNVLAIEKSGIFHGLYHVLNGAVSPLDGIGPEQLTVPQLRERIRRENIDELILATNPTVQGEATAMFLQHEFEHQVSRITRLARGLPAGGDLEYVDDVTLSEAFSGRQPF
ncbi:MAG TPA: recombination mediator RecR [SAR324 cluster bacterium]|jgi:recombination protein RecR|nr:recombination protein RecR [Deltaproteobacteria bacterium]MDP6093548.1 recombination mediator RecR [SAR324 cluster bacterium]MBP45755.1 recombination protein RecR [Deltaproteobacteria bacterium]MDP6246404.1 recombination mediator RecR [SAR324 cluster bacterium]MDP6728729.1 recombination mediator RecR [SAR324 cluster bacterium]|tara:strand:+ start:3794 stop:4390 length:597 start_codon:yes stop_codon:yes gene_type:complete